MKKPFIIHPFIFAVFPALFIAARNFDQISLSEVSAVIAALLFISVFAFLLLKPLFKEGQKAAMAISVFSIFFFSYGHAFDAVYGWRIGGLIIGRERILLPVWTAALFFSLLYIAKRRKKFDNWTYFLNMSALTLLVINIFGITNHLFKIKETPRPRDSNSAVTTQMGEGSEIRRDIYYIILDSYVREDTLKKSYGYDNRHFTDYLRSKDFYVASKSNCNHWMTILSLPSSLNMGYMTYLSDILGSESSSDVMTPRRLVRDNKVSEFLKSKGYKIIWFCSPWSITRYNPNADLNIQFHTWSEFYIILLRTSMLHFLENYIKSDERKAVIRTFDTLAEMPKVKGPKFVFAHLTVPHAPYLFGADGETVAKIEYSEPIDTPRPTYLNQLIFVNKKIKTVIDRIMADSEVLPIIVLQGDHGTSAVPSNVGKDWVMTDEVLREEMGILNAYYLPEGGESLLYETITPVNTFRVIFNYYFKTDYPILKDVSYHSTPARLYKFTDVTDRIK